MGVESGPKMVTVGSVKVLLQVVSVACTVHGSNFDGWIVRGSAPTGGVDGSPDKQLYQMLIHGV